MSVARSETRRRWSVVAFIVAALVTAPVVVAAVRTGLASPVAPGTSPAQLLARALTAGDVPHTAVGESRGSLGMPDIEGLEAVAGLLGSTTRTRVWWGGPTRWRVDTLTATGEIGDYATHGVTTYEADLDGTEVTGGDTTGGSTTTWDYETNTLMTTVGAPKVRLPRSADLLPAQVVGRFLGDLDPRDTVSALPDRRVAGRQAAGFRVRPGDRHSSLTSVDVWVLPNGLPVAAKLLDRAGVPVLTTRYLEVDLAAPPAELLRPPAPEGVATFTGQPPDVESVVKELSTWRLPSSLGGLPASESLAAGVPTYGTGLVRLVVLPLTQDLALRLVLDTRPDVVVLEPVEMLPLGNSVLAAAVVIDGDLPDSFVVVGPVTPDLLRAAARDLLKLPPRDRS